MCKIVPHSLIITNLALSPSSICNNLALIKNIILQSFECNARTDVIYTDFANAFDRINHDILFNNLRSFGFSGSLLLWFRSFLSDRYILIKRQNYVSAPFKVPSGVPQGDHLSTLLFNIFVNDLPSAIEHSQLFLFADDAKIINAIKASQDAVNLQSDINNLVKWSENNCLALNIEKCKFMRYTLIKNPINFNYSILGTILELVYNFKDLVIMFDSKLNFSNHTEMIKNKAMRNLGFIKRTCRSFNDPTALKALYCSLFVLISSTAL